MEKTATDQERWTEFSELYNFYMARGDRWTAEALLCDAKKCDPVHRLTLEARYRLREPLALVLYDAEWQILLLYGEKMTCVCTSILGQEPEGANAALGELIVGYTRRVATNIGLGYAHWKWNGKAPWETVGASRD